VLILLLACEQQSATTTEKASINDSAIRTSDTASTDIDPLSLAAAVDREALRSHIATLESFGSRNIASQTHNDARDMLITTLESYNILVETDEFLVDGIVCTNIIAHVEGTNPSRVWMYSAHYDSTSDQRTTLAPGADDNASAVAALLEATRILSQYQLQDSILFVLTDAEEEGSLGSAHLMQTLAPQNLSIMGAIAPDMIGYWPLGANDAFDILADPASAALAQDMANNADALGVAYKLWVDHFYCYGDDHTNYQEQNIPSISPMDCVEAHNIASSGEHTPHYHQSSDTLETLDLDFTRQVAGVIVATLGGWAGVQ
jgi:Zn-dependent M28 family amino/carboxypeptidase